MQRDKSHSIEILDLNYWDGVISGRLVGCPEGHSCAVLELIIDGKPTASIQVDKKADDTLNAEDGLNGEDGLPFSFAMSPEWLDGREHDIEVRVLGTELRLPDTPLRVLFGELEGPFLYAVERAGDGSVVGWALSKSTPLQPPRLKLIDAEGAVLFEGKAELNLPCRELERLPGKWQVLIPVPNGTTGPLRLDISDDRYKTQIDVAELSEADGFTAMSPHQQVGDICYLVPTMCYPNIAELDQTKSMLLAAANEAGEGEPPITLVTFENGPITFGRISGLIGHDNAMKLKGAKLVRVPPSQLPLNCRRLQKRAYEFNIWAQTQSFKRIVAPSESGVLAYAVDTKAQGLAYDSTELTILVDDLTLLRRTDNFNYVDAPGFLFISTLERRALLRADSVRYLNETLRTQLAEEGYCHEGRAMVDPLAFIGFDQAPPPPDEKSTRPMICFCATLSAAYGLKSFCDSIDKLARHADSFEEQPLILMLGSQSTIFGMNSMDYIEQRAKNWPFELTTCFNKGARMYYNALIGAGTRSICITFARTQGTYFDGLVGASGMERLFVEHGNATPNSNNPERVEHNPSSISDRLADWLAGRVSFECGDDKPSPIGLSEIETEQTGSLTETPAFTKENAPLVSLCVSHFNRPTWLRQTLASIIANDYPNVEIIVVDDGSNMAGVAAELKQIEAWLEKHNGQVIRQKNRYLGAARNNAVAHAKGEFIIFMDDDNIAMPDMISQFIAVQEFTRADVLTAFMVHFQGNAVIEPGLSIPPKIALPLGPNNGAGAIGNVWGDANMLIARKVFEEIGGFTEDYGRGHEDWELLARASLKNYRMELITHPLFWYRVDESGMLGRRESVAVDLLRNIRAYREALPPDLYSLVLLAQGLLTSRNQ